MSGAARAIPGPADRSSSSEVVQLTQSETDRAGGADGFRGDIEGLRAVAVLLVLLYHAQIPGFGGGYVGVDVFFVLSGFLITGILLRELAGTGRISLPGFYARRLRRILPAAALVIVVTVVASAIALPPLQFIDVTRDAAAAILYIPNIRFGLEATDYLQSQQATSPLLHYWSLGVEEQFYLFWPAFVLLLGRGRDRGSFRKRIGIAAVSISVVSLLASIWVTNVNAPWAFFSLPTRAWELGIGATLAVLGSRLAVLPVRLATGMGWLGLAAVGLSGMLLNDSVPFPGTAALFPTLGAAFVICAGFRSGRLAPARLLDTPVPRYLGRISYSLYLWHWPLLVLPAAAAGLPLDPPTRVLLIAASIVMAAVTQRLVENPLRHGRLIGTAARRNLTMAGALSLAVATASVGTGVVVANSLGATATSNLAADRAKLQKIIEQAQIATATDSPQAGSPPAGLPVTSDSPVPAALRPTLADARSVLPPPYSDGCHLGTLDFDYKAPCLYGDPQGSRTLVLIGDSHAVMWWPAIEDLAVHSGWRFYSFTKSGCSPGDIFQWETAYKRMFTECALWRTHTLAKIAAIHPDLAIVSNLSDRTIVTSNGTVYPVAQAQSIWEAGLARTLQRLGQVARQVVMINDTPASQYDVPVCLSEHRDSILACSTPLSKAVEPGWVRATSDGTRATRAILVDPTLWVCPSTPCPPVIGNFLVYRDTNHLATPFAEALAARLGAAIPAFSAAASQSPLP